MTQGRKPKPNVIKLLENNPGGRPLPEELEVEGDIGDMPSWFNEFQAEAWRHVMENAPPGLLKSVDMSLMVVHCVAAGQLKESTLMLEREGMIEYTIKGESKRNNWQLIQSKAMEITLKTASEMGFTPASRQKVTIGTKKPENKFSGNGKRA